MVAAREVSLAMVAEEFGLRRSDEADFFGEWRDNLAELSGEEERAIAQVKADYLHFSHHDIQKSVAKLVVLAPILKLVGLYSPPFHFVVDEKFELDVENDGFSNLGRINILAFHPRLWLTILEAKHTRYSLAIGIPQTLFSMMETSKLGETVFGLVSNGREFQFLKLVKTEAPTYALSYTLCLNREDDLQRVVQILKTLSQLVTEGGVDSGSDDLSQTSKAA